ncbi:MAG: hypothetical protein M5U01_13090 [Ardenticatenaceae bacterium]|nr:hypothetical protein [Ardenticatenaceae bacterium]HBY96418.1 hypothetical protein [Chloroflexota bacterium]
MAKIFVRERRHIGAGAGRPRFAVVGVQERDLKFFRPHLRKAELDAIAAAVGAEVVILPRGSGERRSEEGGGRRRHREQRRREAEEDAASS